jgi:hypothetical protein
MPILVNSVDLDASAEAVFDYAGELQTSSNGIEGE